MVGACCTGLHMLPETARRLGFKHGDYLQVDHDERGTRIVRELVSCNRGCAGMQHDYVYMDEGSAHYLDTTVHETLKVKPSEYTLDCP